MICGDIAFKPIRLACKHYFCLRDLVKMQKRGQDACPACRAPVVMQATGGWFSHFAEESARG
jgi:competence CoiA-like predicted nuclease